MKNQHHLGIKVIKDINSHHFNININLFFNIIALNIEITNVLTLL